MNTNTKMIIAFEATYEEKQKCFCGSMVKHFNQHIHTDKHKKAEKENNLSSVIKPKPKKQGKTAEERRSYMRKYMTKYNKTNKESYDIRKDKYKQYRRENRIKCLTQMYDSRQRISDGERKNHKEELEEKEDKKI